MPALKSLFTPRRDVDMTTGSITRHLINFAVPLLIGNLFQQLYNTVDAWVVGNYVSSEAFSAVGSVGPIINMLIGIFLGLSSGAGVVISQFYGAKRFDEVQKTVHTAVLATILLGIAFTFLGIIWVPVALRLMNTPSEVVPEATAYLTIYFGGILGLMIYNIGSGILRAVGDSNRPFYFLVVCALVNTALDLLFVLGFHMGVEGVALATVLAQGISAVLVLVTLLRTKTCIRLEWRRLRIHGDMFRKILRIGLPAALQSSVTSFSNVFVQSYINHFGAACMAGWTAYGKIDALVLMPMQSLALASTTFVGQNLGAGLVPRAKKGINRAILLSLAVNAVMMVPALLFASPMVAFFNTDPEVVRYGTMFLHWITPFYMLCVTNQIYAGALRGAGNSRAPMVIMLGSFVVFRQIYLYIMANYIANEIIPIALGYPAGWIVCSLAVTIYFHRVPLDKNRLVEDKK